MEDVLDVYQRPYDPQRPQVCLDEASRQMLKHLRVAIAPRPGKPARIDDEYTRCGTANLFVAIEPCTGEVTVQATERRTAKDFASFLRHLADIVYAQALIIVLVMDNLNIHALASLYEAFPPVEARRLAQRFEVHHTPKHGSWLNVAEIAISVIAKQCLDDRIPSLHDLKKRLDAWKTQHTPSKVRWRFTTDDARVKLYRLYPSFQ